MSCNGCDQSWFWAHLGRCRACLFKSLLLSLVLWLGYGAALLAAWPPREVKMVALLVCALAASSLLLLHLLMILRYRRWPQ